MEQGIDYHYYNVIPPSKARGVKQHWYPSLLPAPRLAKCTKFRVLYKQHKVARMYMEDSEIAEALNEYGDRGYDQLPHWLKQELQSRNLPFETRAPASYERSVTIKDHIEHRVMNKELTMQDHLDTLKQEMTNGK